MSEQEKATWRDRLRALAVASDAGWGPDGWYSEHEFQHAFRNTVTDLEADVAYLCAASPDVVVGLLDALAAAEADRDAWQGRASDLFDVAVEGKQKMREARAEAMDWLHGEDRPGGLDGRFAGPLGLVRALIAKADATSEPTP